MDVIFRSILPFLAMLVVLIIVHELGHFITAKIAGVKVLEFGLGFPPKVFGIKRGETEYTLNALPLGGFVRLLGEEDATDPRSLAAQPRWIRIAILSAGAIMNVILAIFLFSLAFMIPREVDISQARIGEVVPNSPAEEAGLEPNDIIVAVNGREIQNIGDLGYLIRLNLGETIDLTVRRSSTEGITEMDVPVYARWTTTTYIDEDGNTRIQGPTGITIGPAHGTQQPIPADVREEIAKELPPGEPVPTTYLAPFTERQSMPPWEAVAEGSRRAGEWFVFTMKWGASMYFQWTGDGASGIGDDGVRGPVGIAQVTGDVVDQAGWQSLLDLAAAISMSLALLNILPLPMLDGGRVAFVVIEYVRRGKRVAPEREAMVHFVGLVAMLALAVVITYFDVLRIFEG